MKDVLVILNPTAGQGRAMKQAACIHACLDERGIHHDLEMTTGVGDATKMAASSVDNKYNYVIAAGGDGTINEVINGLMQISDAEKRPVLGILPIGRGNDFAYGVKIDGSMEEMCDIIAAKRSVPLDVGKITGGDYPEGRFFGNGVGMGFDTRVGLDAAKVKFLHGGFAYMYGAIKNMVFYPKPPHVEITYNGSHKIDQVAPMISIMNGQRMGGTFYMAPDAVNNDGELDLCVAGDVNRRQMIDLFFKYVKGRQAESHMIKTGRAPIFKISAPQGGLVCHADGETICINGTYLEVECHPGALNILSGKP